MSTFATLDHDGAVYAKHNDGPDQRHEVIASLGFADTRREATALLTKAGFTPAGAWRLDTEGESVRTLRHGE